MRLPSVINADGSLAQRRTTALPSERITEDVVGDPKQLAAVLGRLHAGLSKVLRVLGEEQRTGTSRYLGVVVGAAGAQVTIAHKLGYAPQWHACGWRGAAGGHSLVEVSRDATNLVLASYTAGTVDLEVY